MLQAMHHGSDISWQELRRIVQQWNGSAAELAEVKPLHGGSVSTTLGLWTTTGERAVLKVTPHRVDRRYLDEARQLEVLRDAGLPVPKIYAVKLGDLDDPFSYLLLEFLDGVDLAKARRACSQDQFDDSQRHLAELVAAAHQTMNPAYCRVMDAPTPEYSSWPIFFRDVFDPIWAEIAKSKILPVKVAKQIDRIHARLETLLEHDDRPRLLHWDMWCANILAAPDESGRWRITGILDPMSKFGHAEAEIAYLELFQTITPAFLTHYQRVHQLPPEYHRRRKWIYQLYPLIDHVNSFGPDYIKPLLATVAKCAAFA